MKITRTATVEVEINLREELAGLPDGEFEEIAEERGYVRDLPDQPCPLCLDEYNPHEELTEQAYHELRGGTIGPHTRDLFDKLLGRIL